MKRKKIDIHKINLQNKYAYIVKEITLIHNYRWHVTTIKQRVDCNIITITITITITNFDLDV